MRRRLWLDLNQGDLVHVHQGNGSWFAELVLAHWPRATVQGLTEQMRRMPVRFEFLERAHLTFEGPKCFHCMRLRRMSFIGE